MTKAASITSTDPCGRTTTSYTSSDDPNIHGYVADRVHRGHTNIVVSGHKLGLIAAGGHVADGVAAEADAVHGIAPWPCPRPDDPEGCYCPTEGPCLAADR